MPRLNPMLIFLEASHAALVRRFSETRRPHPLAPDRSVSEGIREERARLNAIREHGRRDHRHVGHDGPRAAAVLHGPVARPVARAAGRSRFSASATSTACRSTPIWCSTCAACRIRISSRRCGAGPAATARSCEFMERDASTREFMDRLEEYLRYVIPHYVAEGKSYLTIAIGCTGGRHRSVMIAERLRARARRCRRRAGARPAPGHRAWRDGRDARAFPLSIR